MKRRRMAIRDLKRGSRARRERQVRELASRANLFEYRLDLDWGNLPRKWIGWHRSALRRLTGVGWLYWAPAPTTYPVEFGEGWVSLGYIDEAEGFSWSWPPYPVYSQTDGGRVVLVDELHHWTTHMEGGAIDGPGPDWYRHRKP